MSGGQADYIGYGTNAGAYHTYKVTRGGAGRDPLFIDQHETKTLSSRGSYLPYLIGRRRIDPVFAWAGDRVNGVVGSRAGGKGGGGGGGGGGQTAQLAENAWHLLCVGPAFELHRIWVSGKIVWEGPIDRDTSPSGTSVNVPGVGNFEIYWGETDQPINLFLGDPSRVGITSRWPYHCYVVWTDFLLGSQPTWPIVSYDIETQIEDDFLSQSAPGSQNVPGPGVNVAHAISQVLFGPFPRGLSRDQGLFDLLSLEGLGSLVSRPSEDFVPLPINGTLLANYDSAQESTVERDGAGYVTRWFNSISPADPNQAVSSLAGREPVFYDGEGVTPTGLDDRGQSLLNECPGLYFNSDFLTILEGVNNPIPANLSANDYWGYVAAVTIYPQGVGGAGGNAGRVGCVIGARSSAAGTPTTDPGLFPEDPDGVYLAAGVSTGPDESVYRCAVATDFPVSTEGQSFISNAPNPITMILGVRYERINTGQAIAEVYVSVINGGDPTTTVIPSYVQNVTQVVMGGFRSNLTSPDFYLDAVLHQAVYLSGNPGGSVLENDITLYLEWMRQRWGACANNPDSRSYSTNALAANGKTAGQLLGELLRDSSCGIRWNSQVGKFQFVPFRANQDVIVVPREFLSGPPTQIETVHFDREAEKIVFSFVDVDHGFQKQTIVIDNDGMADLATYAKAKEIDLPTVVDFDSAESISNRRILEEQENRLRVTLTLNHEGRIYHPGEVLSVPDIPYLLRVTDLSVSNRSGGRSGDVKVTCIPDIYGTEEFFSRQEPTGTGDSTGQPAAPQPDVAFGIFELPECLLPVAGVPVVIIPRVRSSGTTAFANVYLSDDDVSYNLKGQEFDFQVGGTLDIGIADSDPYLIPVGPTITIQGLPDDQILDDLTGQDSLWQNGSQLLLIGEELFYLQRLVAVGGLTYRLEGMIRARQDTVREAHFPGDQVFIVRPDQILPVTDAILLQPFNDVWVKSQPVASSALSLAAIPSAGKVIYGKGIRPPPPIEFRVFPAASFSYVSGDDIDFRWNYYTCGAGAGTVSAGVPHSAPLPNMTFELEVWDSGFTTLLRAELLALSASFTYTNADILIDLGIESDFGVRLFSRRNGYRSSAVERVVTLV